MQENLSWSLTLVVGFFRSDFLRQCEKSQDNRVKKQEQKLEQDSACVVCPKMINSVCGPEQIICFLLTKQNKLIFCFHFKKPSACKRWPHTSLWTALHIDLWFWKERLSCVLNCRLLLPAQELSSGEWWAFRETNGSPLCLLTIHKLLIYNLNNRVFGISKTIVIILIYIAFILLYVSLPDKSLLSFQDYHKIRYRSRFKELCFTYVGCWLPKGKDVLFFFSHCLFWLFLYRQGFWAKPLIIFVLMFYIVY